MKMFIWKKVRSLEYTAYGKVVVCAETIEEARQIGLELIKEKYLTEPQGYGQTLKDNDAEKDLEQEPEILDIPNGLAFWGFGY